MTRQFAILAALCVAAGFLVGSAAARAPSPHATLLTGEYWVPLSPKEKQAYLTGFIAGAAAEQVRSEANLAGRSADSSAISTGAIERLRKTNSLWFRFAPTVYMAQVSDYYWWQNHVDTPLVDVVIFWNREWLKLQEQSRP